jgi:hypothetical protein
MVAMAAQQCSQHRFDPSLKLTMIGPAARGKKIIPLW